MSSPSPPPPNPVLSAYESYVQETPLVTRYTLNAITFTFILGFIVDTSYALSNIPFFVIFRFELYRLVLAPFLCESLLTLIIFYFSFLNYGKRLEVVMGSTNFGFIIFSIGTLTNITFLVISIINYILTQNSAVLLHSTSGIWTVLLGVIALECSSAPEGSKRKLFVVDVPTKYYPLVLVAFFAMLSGGGFPVSYLISVGIGYSYGYGKLDRLKLGVSRRQSWEASLLRKFTMRQGWIVGPSEDDWEISNSNGQQTWQPTIVRPPAIDTTNSPTETPSSSTISFQGSGRSLGTTRRHNPDRSAMLEAAERRAATVSSQDEEMGD